MNISFAPTGPTTTVPNRHFDSVKALDAETQNGRIWLGLHFRTAMVAGSKIGHAASAWVIAREFQPTCRHGRQS